MKNDFKKWLCKLSGEKTHNANGCHRDLARLIRAMWVINRDVCNKYNIDIGILFVYITSKKKGKDKTFYYSQHNFSEQEALTKALEYIYEQEIKNEKENLCI